MRIWFRRDPDERERRRRLQVNLTGRLGDAVVTDADDNAIYYSYSVRGVEYTTAQDLSQLRQVVPKKLDFMIGPALLKYVPSDPGNSIIVCEAWCGVPARSYPRSNSS